MASGVADHIVRRGLAGDFDFSAGRGRAIHRFTSRHIFSFRARHREALKSAAG